jgi:hypothetical protein
MTCLTPRTICLTGFAIGFAALLAGCATQSASPISVKTDLTQAAVAAAEKKYALAFVNRESEEILLPYRLRLDAALARLGYQPVLPMDATVIVHLFAEQDRLIIEKRAVNSAESYAASNPDSTRYKNIAGMVSGGRYSSMLNDRPTNPGEVFIGPENEIRTTGDMRPDSERRGPAVEQDVPRKINRLVLIAHDAPLPADTAQATIRWRVEVVGNVPRGDPSPAMDQMFETAVQTLAKESHGARAGS